MDIVNWRKARASAADNGCVEVGTRTDGMVMVRDTKNRERGHLAVDVANWLKFVAEVKASLRSTPKGVAPLPAWPSNLRPKPRTTGQLWVSCSQASYSMRSSTASSGVRRSGASSS